MEHFLKIVDDFQLLFFQNTLSQSCLYGIFIINFEHISHLILLFLLLNFEQVFVPCVPLFCCSYSGILMRFPAVFRSKINSKTLVSESQMCNFTKKVTLTQVFSYELCQIFWNIFFIRHLQWLLLLRWLFQRILENNELKGNVGAK